MRKIYKYECQNCANIQYSERPPREIHICDKCGRVDIKFKAVNISYCIPQKIYDIIVEEITHRNQVGIIGQSIYEWTTKEGKTLNLRKMKTEHLQNILRMLEKKYRKEK